MEIISPLLFYLHSRGIVAFFVSAGLPKDLSHIPWTGGVIPNRYIFIDQGKDVILKMSGWGGGAWFTMNRQGGHNIMNKVLKAVLLGMVRKRNCFNY